MIFIDRLNECVCKTYLDLHGLKALVVYDTRIGFHVLKILFGDIKLPLCFQLQNHYSSRMV
jgi:hypothetical protein